MKKMVVFLLVFLSLSTFSAARRSQGIVTYSFQFNNFIQTKLNANEGAGTVKEKKICHYLLIHPFVVQFLGRIVQMKKMIYWNVDKRIESYAVNNLKLLIYLLL